MQLRQTVRRFARAPGFTLTTVLTLAIGTGATTAIFAVVNGVLLKPLPFPESDRLVALQYDAPARAGEDLPASPALYYTYKEHNQTFESVALYVASTDSITGSGNPEEVPSLAVTHEFLPTLRVAPALGRGFTDADDQLGSASTVLLSYGYWQRHFGGAEAVLGTTLTVDGTPRTIIGVLPQDFRFLQRDAEIMVPLQPVRALAAMGPLGEQGLARLKPGVTLAEASADMARMFPLGLDMFPPRGGNRQAIEETGFRPDPKLLQDKLVGELRDVLWVLLGTIGLLLLIACANVANLQLVRTEARTHELAMRAALGADRRALAKSLLLESTLLGIAGGALGLTLAALTLPVFLTVAAEQLPRALDVTIDPTVLAFAAAISLGSGLLFGSIPALKHAGARAATLLGGRTQTLPRERHRARNALVVVQVALALVLLVGSGLMIRTFQSLRDVEPGFTAPEQLQTVTLTIPQAAVAELDRAIRMQNDIEDRIAAMTGVESVGFSTVPPLSGNGPSGPYFAEDKPLPPGALPPETEFRFVSPSFFAAFGTPLVAGRAFDWADTYERRHPAIVSASFARRVWGSPDAALGKRVQPYPGVPWQDVVGVVADVRHNGLEQPAPDTVYLTPTDTMAQWGMARTVTYVVRSDRVGTAGFMSDIQQAIWAVNPALPLGNVRTMQDLYDGSLARTALTLTLLSIAGAMALALGLLGVYGVISYMLSQRAKEIGIRMALGAENASLRRLLVAHVVALVAVGVVLGLAGAAGLTQLMTSLLFGVTALDATTYVVVTAVLVAAALTAGYLPARRVTRVDPMQALRAE